MLGRAAIWWIPLLGTLLVFGAVGPYTVLDDHVLALTARGEPGLEARWDLFTFTTGEPAANKRLIEQGMMLPWWADERLKVAFYRPLSSLSHRLDYALWPHAPSVMYLHSLAWLALTLHLVARCYRRLEVSPSLAGLCALLYAIDEARGPVVAWISNRNALIATAFGALALIAHDRWRRSGQSAFALVGPACLFLGLLSAELALSTLAYLAAYTLLLDRAAPPRRVQALSPYAAVIAGWMVLYLASGATVHGSGTYLSPLHDLEGYFDALPERASALLGATLGPLPADLALFGRSDQALPRLAATSLVLGAAAYALWPALRRDRLARFWALGMVLAVLPIAASPPGDRLLSFMGIGGIPLVARIVEPLRHAALWRSGVRRSGVAALAFAVVHAVLAPLLLPLRAAQMQLLGRTLDDATSFLDQVPQLQQRTVVIVNAPVDLLASYIQAERASRGAPRAARLFWLTSSGSPASVRRSDERTLLIERENGFLSTPLETHYRGRPSTLQLGSTVQLTHMTARVEKVTSDGRPLAVSFRFAEELESSSYVFLIWKRDRYQPLDLAGVSQTLRLPAEDLGQILARTAFGATI